ncbi:MAG: hypothetical protein GXY44_13960 [Phycisphaerales bacterium]|nr:hypothetical protein [Phycisphaerales bacterium]
MKTQHLIVKRGLWFGLAIASAAAMITGAWADTSTETRPADTRPADPLDRESLLGTSEHERAVIIPITGTITDITRGSIERRLEYVREAGIDLVIFEFDTPGGVLGTTLEICTDIKRLRQEGISSYAWINPQAYSAGTIIALATEGIFMSSFARMGDCQPIMMTGTGVSAVPEEIEAKATSPLVAELRDSAQRNGYSYLMTLSLIRPEMEIWWLENTQTGEKRFVNTQERDRLMAADEGTEKKEKGLLDYISGRREGASGDKTETGGEPTWRYVDDYPALGKVHQPIVEADKQLLTMTTPEALAYGFARAELNNEQELREYFRISGSVERLEDTYMETFVQWLASPMVRGVLFLLMLLGAYTEFHTPGIGVAGAVALVCLVLFLGAPYMAGITMTWEIVAIVLGIILLLIELFVLPGFGVAGIMGLLLLMVGLLFSFVPPEPVWDDNWFRMPTLPDTYTYFQRGLYALAGGLAGSIVGAYFIARFLPQTSVGRMFIPPNPTHEQVMMVDAVPAALFVGAVGTAQSMLRPAGKALFVDTLADVVTLGEFVEKGSRVEIVERHGARIVVRQVS